ncbi:MAG: phosphate acyltransferase PlsX [Clostridia bacterium]|nr:phosphate acyltransferase PlsX [Clostridia bacterium]
MSKIVIDAFGGDNAPVEIVKGAIEFINEVNDVDVVLVGKEKEISMELSKYDFDMNRVTIENANDVIDNNDTPTVAIRQKKDSSLVKAFDYLNAHDDAVGVLSAGSTGAVLTGGFLKIGRIKGVQRPALCPLIPTISGGRVALCDCGANMDCKPQYLLQFAILASEYMRNVEGIENPRVGLLNVGTEDHKGNPFTQEVFALLKDCADVNFVRNMEARDAMSGNYDVVVADGFNGNVLLKSMEGTALSIVNVLKDDIKSHKLSMFGALFMKGTFKRLKKVLDYHSSGGAILLGCKKLLVKAHGSCTAVSVKACLYQINDMYKSNITGLIAEKVAKVGAFNE